VSEAPIYTIFIGYDPSGVSWLGQDPEMTAAQRAIAFEKIESGEWEIYEVLLIENCPERNCPERGWQCANAKHLDEEGYIITENGHHGVYDHPDDISEAALKRVAQKMWTAVQV
jgi:hypothetical protein